MNAMSTQDLQHLAQSLMARGKGILAADESVPTITRRFEKLGIESTEQTRRDYREMLFATPRLGQYISGAILFDETLRQTTAAGEGMVQLLQRQGILPGIKVDLRTMPLANFPGEKATRGVDGLDQRLPEYAERGARFTKFRAVFSIGHHLPSDTAVAVNAQTLARFAAISQEAGLLPIVEPEVLMEGEHPIERCFEVTLRVLRAVFHHLYQHRVTLEAMILKTNMILPGFQSAKGAGVAEVAELTLRCLRQAVPPAVGGIAFLSGGQGEADATAHLAAINAMGEAPWPLGFSYARALQNPAMKTWAGRAQNTPAAQSALYERAKANGQARLGMLTSET